MQYNQRENKEVSSDDLVRIGLQLELAAQMLDKENKKEERLIQPKLAVAASSSTQPLIWTITKFDTTRPPAKKANSDSQERELVFQNYGRRLTKKNRPEDRYIIEFGFK